MEQFPPLCFTRNRNRRDRIGMDSKRPGSKNLRRTSPSVPPPRACPELVKGLASKERTRTWGTRLAPSDSCQGNIYSACRVKFSERYGHKTARGAVQLDSIDNDLRTSLWNLLRLYIWNHVKYSPGHPIYSLSASNNEEIADFCTDLWCDHLKKPLDDLDDDWEVAVEEIKQHFFSCKWYEVYDFIEFAIEKFPYSAKEEFVEGQYFSGNFFWGGLPNPTTEVQPCLSSKSPATKKKNTTEITPFMVKNAAFSLLKSSCRTSVCS